MTLTYPWLWFGLAAIAMASGLAAIVLVLHAVRVGLRNCPIIMLETLISECWAIYALSLSAVCLSLIAARCIVYLWGLG